MSSRRVEAYAGLVKSVHPTNGNETINAEHVGASEYDGLIAPGIMDALCGEFVTA